MTHDERLTAEQFIRHYGDCHSIRLSRHVPVGYGRLSPNGPAFFLGGRSVCLYSCECGGYIVADCARVKTGNTRSCGCLGVESRITHGQSGGASTPEYRAWSAIISRCENPKNKAFHNYGGRGIVICKRWRTSFENFLHDMGPRPPAHSIDRINNDGHYEPGNCRWATNRVQHRNKRTNRILEISGKRMTVADWAEQPGAESIDAIRKRLRLGWPQEWAVFAPPKVRFSTLIKLLEQQLLRENDCLHAHVDELTKELIGTNKPSIVKWSEPKGI